MSLQKQQINNLADYLRGTGRSLDEGLAAIGLYALEPEDQTLLAALVFECNCCGWWYESAERTTKPGGRVHVCVTCAVE